MVYAMQHGLGSLHELYTILSRDLTEMAEEEKHEYGEDMGGNSLLKHLN